MTGSTATAHLSKSEWIQQADAICTVTNVHLEPIEEQLAEAKEHADLEKLAGILNPVNHIGEDEISKLEALPAPKGDEEKIGGFIAADVGAVHLSGELQQAISEGVENGLAEKAEVLTEEINRDNARYEAEAKAYGLKVCGHSE